MVILMGFRCESKVTLNLFITVYGEPRYRWRDNIKMNCKLGCENVDWRWAGQVVHVGGMRNAYTILVWKT
jgi:hypothetical protein